LFRNFLVSDMHGSEVYMLHHHHKVVISIPDQHKHGTLLAELTSQATVLQDCSDYTVWPDEGTDKPDKTIPLAGFGAKSDAEIQVMDDDCLYVVLKTLPPSFKGYLGRAKEFAWDMEQAIGVPVYWLDREVFLIESIDCRTIGRIKQFFERYSME
jgi:hypothetical protein